MDRQNLLVKTIELLMRFTRKLLQGSVLCTMVIVILSIIIFDVIFRI